MNLVYMYARSLKRDNDTNKKLCTNKMKDIKFKKKRVCTWIYQDEAVLASKISHEKKETTKHMQKYIYTP